MLAAMPPIESREDAAACFERLITEKLIRARDLDTQPFRFFLRHELVGVHDLSLLFLMSAHFNLYAGTLMRLGSKKHREASRRADEGQIGCFALTEGCHGVTSGLYLDTVARYDHARQCFVLSTPTPEAQKIWITNAGYFAENAVVMARLLVGSEDHGLHAFLVPLRLRRGAPTFAGIATQDVGQKTCLTNADMANITFDQVMVPREGLLDRHTRVDAQGNADSAVYNHLIWKSFAAQAEGRDLGVDRLFALRCIQRDASGFARYAGLRSRQLAGVERAIRRLCDDLEPQLERLMPTSARAIEAVTRDVRR